MYCNVTNYKKKTFLIIIGVVMQSNCLGFHCLRWQQTRRRIIWGELRESHLSGFHYPGAIFQVAIIWR